MKMFGFGLVPTVSFQCLFPILQRLCREDRDFKAALKELIESRQLYLVGKNILPFHFGLPEARKIEPEEIYSAFVSDQKEVARNSKIKELLALIEKAIKTAEKKLSNLKEDLCNAKGKH